MELLTLRNGAHEPDVAVWSVLVHLRSFLADEPIAFYELVCSARDRSHKLWGQTGDRLVAAGLLEVINPDGTGEMNRTVRAVVESAVTGEGLSMTIGTPAPSTEG